MRNDLFVAHESIYRFCQRFTSGQQVLDAGCGTGYGAFLLARAGAEAVLGVDIDPRNVRFARKRYGAPNLTFEVADIERLNFPEESFGLVVASNALEHLHDPSEFLRLLRRFLKRSGCAVIAVPPIYTDRDVQIHHGIHYHRSNLSVRAWAELIADAGFVARGVAHHHVGKAPNFRSHLPSELTAADFTFTEGEVEALWEQPSITAVFLLRER